MASTNYYAQVVTIGVGRQGLKAQSPRRGATSRLLSAPRRWRKAKCTLTWVGGGNAWVLVEANGKTRLFQGASNTFEVLLWVVNAHSQS
jgi:hypothetical protein